MANQKSNKCGCGCGQSVSGSFAQGHDAIAKSKMIKAHGSEVVKKMVSKFGVLATVQKLGFRKVRKTVAVAS